MSLPEPGAVFARAREAGERTRDGGLARDASIPNVAVEMAEPEPDVERSDGGGRYVGSGAPEFGLLAAAGGVEGIALHHPQPDLTAEGPWLVLRPLSGVVSTVAKGTGEVIVELAHDRAADHRLDGIERLVSDVFAAARPVHDHYPVAEDDRGVFRTGMTTYTPAEIEVGASAVTVRLDVSTTPATAERDVVARFSTVDGVRSVTYEPGIGAERAEPSPALRAAVEDAHRAVLGDAPYDWAPEPAVFSRIPGRQKIAFGTGVRGSEEFDAGAFRTCVALLSETVSRLGGGE